LTKTIDESQTIRVLCPAFCVNPEKLPLASERSGFSGRAGVAKSFVFTGEKGGSKENAQPIAFFLINSTWLNGFG